MARRSSVLQTRCGVAVRPGQWCCEGGSTVPRGDAATGERRCCEGGCLELWHACTVAASRPLTPAIWQGNDDGRWRGCKAAPSRTGGAASHRGCCKPAWCREEVHGLGGVRGDEDGEFFFRCGRLERHEEDGRGHEIQQTWAFQSYGAEGDRFCPKIARPTPSAPQKEMLEKISSNNY